ACVNPDHLFVGTQADNIRDAKSKGRIKSREESILYRGSMTMERAREIRAARAAGVPNDVIAKKFGISKGYASTVGRGIHWPEPEAGIDVPSPDPMHGRFAA
ncbi:MAG: hypothetical protein KGL35_29985, partial [Bradyrhizobium sp.]|nr:hypothetical protein [Bradyrhizobium sp.]